MSLFLILFDDLMGKAHKRKGLPLLCTNLLKGEGRKMVGDNGIVPYFFVLLFLLLHLELL